MTFSGQKNQCIVVQNGWIVSMKVDGFWSFIQYSEQTKVGFDQNPPIHFTLVKANFRDTHPATHLGTRSEIHVIMHGWTNLHLHHSTHKNSVWSHKRVTTHLHTQKFLDLTNAPAKKAANSSRRNWIVWLGFHFKRLKLKQDFVET